MKMTERKSEILKIIVEEFIKTAQPVGSKLMIEKFHLPFSSATIRNEMQELEENGYLEKPHTSAGRIPSAKGYRFYIEHLRSHSQKNEITTAFEYMFDNRTLEIEEVIRQTSQLLSQMTNLTSIVLPPLLSSMGKSCFYLCTALIDINWNEKLLKEKDKYFAISLPCYQ